MKKLLTFGFLVLVLASQAQITRGLKDDYDTKDFPKISFVWNSVDPQQLQKDQFVLMENDKTIPFDFEIINKGVSQQNKKSILFLWEDMKSHSHQSENAQELLKDFFDKTEFNAGDRFNVAVFNRKKPGEAVLKPMMSDFSTKTDRLREEVIEHKKSTESFSPNPDQADLYQAINDGIDMLKNEPSDHVGVIIVITQGLNMKASGATTEMESARKKAVEAGIPIYVVKYAQQHGDVDEVNNLAKGTYGDVLQLKDKKVDDALIRLQNLYKKGIDERIKGVDYKLTFTTSAERDGKTHAIRMTVNKVPQNLREFTAPTMSFGLWVKEHLWLCIALVLLVIILIVVIILLIVSSGKKRKAREAENKAEMQRKIDAANQERANLERNLAAQAEQQRNAERAKANQAEAARLLQMMRTKNMLPRLQCNAGGETFSYQINNTVTRIGRGRDNDVVLNHQTVSKYHAEIVFSGSAFEVVNKSTSYTQGVIVNGQFFQRAVLKSGDIIGLGEAVVTFYV